MLSLQLALFIVCFLIALTSIFLYRLFASVGAPSATLVDEESSLITQEEQPNLPVKSDRNNRDYLSIHVKSPTDSEPSTEALKVPKVSSDSINNSDFKTLENPLESASNRDDNKLSEIIIDKTIASPSENNSFTQGADPIASQEQTIDSNEPSQVSQLTLAQSITPTSSKQDLSERNSANAEKSKLFVFNSTESSAQNTKLDKECNSDKIHIDSLKIFSEKTYKEYQNSVVPQNLFSNVNTVSDSDSENEDSTTQTFVKNKYPSKTSLSSNKLRHCLPVSKAPNADPLVSLAKKISTEIILNPNTEVSLTNPSKTKESHKNSQSTIDTIANTNEATVPSTPIRPSNSSNSIPPPPPYSPKPDYSPQPNKPNQNSNSKKTPQKDQSSNKQTAGKKQNQKVSSPSLRICTTNHPDRSSLLKCNLIHPISPDKVAGRRRNRSKKMKK
ncbi:hypothetical protein AYI68_g5452 [Smittium mucronatum]|nr:hypothetical protein AYI68_g5452 [Smittium mucronatum]